MSRVLPCPVCGDHMWDNQATCDACKPAIFQSSRYGKSAIMLDIFLRSTHKEVLCLCLDKEHANSVYQRYAGHPKVMAKIYYSKTKREPIKVMIDELDESTPIQEYFIDDDIEHWGVILTKRDSVTDNSEE